MSGQVFHGPMLKVNPNFRVVKILERTKNLSAQLFPEAEIVRDYSPILNDNSVELVIVNTPDYLHFEMAKAALKAGKHVVVEKPFTLTSEEAKNLVSLAKEKNVVLSVYQNRRWDGDFLTVQKVLNEKLLGRLAEFESHFDRYRNIVVQDTWKEAEGNFGGSLYNLGSHMVDQALVLFGKPVSVTAHLEILRDGGKIFDYYDIRLQYEGFAAILRSSLLVRELGPRYILHGTHGSFLKWGIDPQEELLKAGHLPEGDGWGKEPENLWGLLNSVAGSPFNGRVETIPGDYRIFYNNIYETIRDGAELFVKPEEAVLSISILEACIESNRLKKTIFL